MPIQDSSRQFNLRWHKSLGWWAAAAILIWSISAITHPLMAWLGPKEKHFYPPGFILQAQQLQTVQVLLAGNTINQARVVKVVAGQQGPLLQVTETAEAPRRYFDLQEGQELRDFDQQQARWLASYYSGRSTNEISNITLKTAFDNEYPWVNRLLPVYKVTFAGDDQLTTFVHTETNALAGISNNTKQQLQILFQTLHTWNWLALDSADQQLPMELGRVLLIALFMLCLTAMAFTGLSLVFLLKHRKMHQPSRYWHRLLGYVLWLPLLGWSCSGFYHLLQAAYIAPASERTSGVQLPAPMALDKLFSIDAVPEQSITASDLNHLPEGTLNALAVVTHKQEYYYRLSYAVEDQALPSRKQVYQGRPKENAALYLNAQTGKTLQLSDQQQAEHLASVLSGLDSEQIIGSKKITRFGPGYDFRNKRLPVWQIDFADDEGLRVFVDTASGVLVDQNRQLDRIESWSFSLLHKWNHLNPLMGRFNRDLLIVASLLITLLFTTFGVWLLIGRRRKVPEKPQLALVKSTD